MNMLTLLDVGVNRNYTRIYSFNRAVVVCQGLALRLEYGGRITSFPVWSVIIAAA